ncbi:MAG: hypothetical protein K8S55_01750 [Phycisphaerae bacterium]|nr:hypothetical protein [Phycisphaerae bacterium]
MRNRELLKSLILVACFMVGACAPDPGREKIGTPAQLQFLVNKLKKGEHEYFRDTKWPFLAKFKYCAVSENIVDAKSKIYLVEASLAGAKDYVLVSTSGEKCVVLFAADLSEASYAIKTIKNSKFVVFSYKLGGGSGYSIWEKLWVYVGPERCSPVLKYKFLMNYIFDGNGFVDLHISTRETIGAGGRIKFVHEIEFTSSDENRKDVSKKEESFYHWNNGLKKFEYLSQESTADLNIYDVFWPAAGMATPKKSP